MHPVLHIAHPLASGVPFLSIDFCHVLRDASCPIFVCPNNVFQVVPLSNPDAVPSSVSRDVETVSPLCLDGVICVDVLDDSEFVAAPGFCRKATAAGANALCTAPAAVHTIPWANPAVSGQGFDESTVAGAMAGDYLEWTWDDVVHDVWLIGGAAAAIDPCDNITGNPDATQLIPPSHHATFDPTTNLLVPGRNQFLIPESAMGTTLVFVCSVNGHCYSGQVVEVAVGSTPATPDTSSHDGVCPTDYTLCPDESLQTDTTAEVETAVNVPWMDPVGAADLRLAGTVSRAQTPWEDWERRQLDGKVCADRDYNPVVAPYWGPNSAPMEEAWHFGDATLREAVAACSSNHPAPCTGISMRLAPGNSDPFVGKHEFRRCLGTDGYTRLVTVDSLPPNETAGFTLPIEYTKSVACPWCYQCREVPLPPKFYPHSRSHWGPYAEYRHPGMTIEITDPGTAGATITVSQPQPTRGPDEVYRMGWEHEPELVCRAHPSLPAPLRTALPPLQDDADWVTFLLPEADVTSPVIDSIAAGFVPPEAATSWKNTAQGNLAAVYPPGQQVDPSETTGDWVNRDWNNMSIATDQFELPAQTLSGDRGGSWWPPKPTLKVTFMPADGGSYLSAEEVAETVAASELLGWHVDNGNLDGSHTNGQTGQTAEFGWRCSPQLAWYGARSGGVRDFDIPPFAFGVVKAVGQYHAMGANYEVCPDGRPNAWEATVANGVYMVTIGRSEDTGYNGASSLGQWTGCTFENVKPIGIGNSMVESDNTGLRDGLGGGGPLDTIVFSVEVTDGRITLASAGMNCVNMNWIKLDLITSTLFPAPWLPAAPREWYQLALDETAPIGLVQIILPSEEHNGATDSGPHDAFNPAAASRPDCRKWWLYSPATCYRMFVLGQKRGPHPDLGAYPDFPGFSEPFLGWLFDRHDTSGDGVLQFEEFRAAAAIEATDGPFAIWDRSRPGTIRPFNSYIDDNAGHLWQKIDVLEDVEDGVVAGDGNVTRESFVHGFLSVGRRTFCDQFEETRSTHGANWDLHSCRKWTATVPNHWGEFADDGQHGFVVTVSDTPCTEEGGCPTVEDTDSNTTLCEFRLSRSASSTKIDCRGATGSYVHITLPGDGRILAETAINVHRANMPTVNELEVPLATDPAIPMVCYGLVARPVPAVDDPNLLAGAKLHPRQIVVDNPEDPVFWSTCYERLVEKTWLPLESESGSSALDMVDYAFLNETLCLNCESVRANLAVAYDVDAMLTPHWWLQPDGDCEDCNYEIWNLTASPSFTAPTGSPASTSPTLAPVTHTIPWGRTTAAAGGTVDPSSFSITIVAMDVVRWELVDGGHNVVSTGPDDRFTSSEWMPGATDVYSVTFDQPGTYRYICEPHSDMVGTITVVPQGLTEAPTTSRPTLSPTQLPTPSPTPAPSLPPTRGPPISCVLTKSALSNPTTGRTHSYCFRDPCQSWIGGGNGWGVLTSDVGGQAWLLIDLGESVEVAGVTTQSRSNRDQYVTTFTAQYSVDNVAFSDVPGVLTGPNAEQVAESRDTEVNARFPTVVTARYIKIFPQTYESHPVMRVGVLVDDDDLAPCLTSAVDGAAWTEGFSAEMAPAISAFIEQMMQMSDASECPNSLPFALAPLFSVGLRNVGGDPCCVLAEGHAENTGAGFVFVRIAAGDGVLPVHIHAPHPGGDAPTELQAFELFAGVRAKSLVVAGARTDATADPSACQTDRTAADAAHNTDSITFLAAAATAAFHGAATGWAVIELHGMESTACAEVDVYVTPGMNALPGSGNLGLLQENLQAELPDLTIVRPLQATQCDLHGTSGTAGRYLNGVSAGNVCDTPAVDADGSFIHIVQKPALLTTGTHIASVASAITQTWAAQAPAPTPSPTPSPSTPSPTPSPAPLCTGEPEFSFCFGVRKYWSPASPVIRTVSWGYDVSQASITIRTGDTVKWVLQQDGHDVVSGATWGTTDGKFNSNGHLDNLTPADKWSFTFETPGTYPYYCTPHSSMVATITVVNH